MPTTTEPKAKWVLSHDDGPCKDGQMNTPLVGGLCLVCKFHPDMQSTAFVFHCPVHDVRLDEDNKCGACGVTFSTKKD